MALSGPECLVVLTGAPRWRGSSREIGLDGFVSGLMGDSGLVSALFSRLETCMVRAGTGQECAVRIQFWREDSTEGDLGGVDFFGA